MKPAAKLANGGTRECTLTQVMDMASGKVYFWNSATDEVAWEPPEGSVPRSKQDTDAVFAAEQDRCWPADLCIYKGQKSSQLYVCWNSLCRSTHHHAFGHDLVPTSI